MFVPVIPTWIEEANQLVSIAVDGADIATFRTIAGCAGISEIIDIVRAAVFEADDVVDLTAPEGVGFGNAAIFTAIAGA